ncbi:MAG: DUF4388 domain-containing protein [Myxococcota bacterium]
MAVIVPRGRGWERSVRGAVLLVIADGTARSALGEALSARGFAVFEAPDTAHAMAALGRARFELMVTEHGPRPLALKGLCLLARKRHLTMRIFVLKAPTAQLDAAHLPDVGERYLDARMNATMLANQIFAEMMRGGMEEFDIPSTTQVWSTLEAAAEEQRTPFDEPATAVTPPPQMMEPSVTQNLGTCVLIGDFEEQNGSALLMTILAQDLTGFLNVTNGPAEGLLYFYMGEPVWMEDVTGDAGLLVQLIRMGRLPQRVRRPEVPEGQLVNALVQSGALSAQAAQEAMLVLIRQRVMSLVGQRTGTYKFHEERTFVDRLPLLKVNSFGLLLEAHRQQMGGDRLRELTRAYENHALVAGPALDAAAPRIAPFVRGAYVDKVLADAKPVTTFWREVGLDALAGTLLVHTMVEARLVTVQRSVASWRVPTVRLTPLARQRTEEFMTLPDTEIENVSLVQGRPEEQKTREEIIQLYLRIKPQTTAYAVLGVTPGADLATVERAYRGLLTQLEPSRVPGGASQALLQSHLHELRRKVDAAYNVLMRAQTGPRRSPW